MIRAFTVIAVLLVLGATACRPSNPASPGSSAPETAPSASASGAAQGVKLRIEVDGEPAVGPNPVTVYLLEGAEGVSGASVEVTGDMTHAGMVPVVADAAEVEPGLYRAEGFEFTMAGDWVLSAEATLPDGRTVSGESAVTVPGR